MAVNKNLTVMIAIDGSDKAEFALKWYVDCIHRDDSSVILFHAVEPLTVIGECPSVDIYEKMVGDEKHRSETLEAKFKGLLESKQIHATFISVSGNRPGENIVDTAKKNNVQLIVMGTRGLNRNRRTMMGSVSDYVMHHASCPVLICRCEEAGVSQNIVD